MPVAKKRKKEEREAFLADLRSGIGVLKAIANTGQGQDWWYKWRNSDEDFEDEWDAAVKAGAKIKLAVLEAEADRRAVDGFDVTTKEVVKSADGKTIGKQMMRTVRQYSDTCLIFRTKAEAKRAGVRDYDDRVQQQSVNLNLNKPVDDMSEEELEILLGKMAGD